MRFMEHYEKLDENDLNAVETKQGSLDEISLPDIISKTRYVSNIFRKKSKKFNPLDPQFIRTTKEIGQNGYNQLIGMLAQDITDKGKERKKIFVKDYYRGVWDKDKAPDILPDDIKDVQTYVYKTNKGGNVIVYDVEDENGEKTYYTAIDPKGDQYFVQRLGMPYTAFVSRSQGAGKPFVTGKKVEKETDIDPTIIRIDKEKFSKYMPAVSESVEESSDLDEAKSKRQATKEGKRYVTKVGDEWYRVDKAEDGTFKVQKNNPVFSLTDKDIAVDEQGNPNEGLEKEKQEKIKTEKEPEEKNKETDKEIEASKDRVKKYRDAEKEKESDKEPEEEPKKEEPKKEEPKKEEPKKEPEDDIEIPSPTGEDEISKKLKKELQKGPLDLKPTKTIKKGWQWVLKNGGQVFLYVTTKGSYALAYTKKAHEALSDKDFITTGSEETLKEPID